MPPATDRTERLTLAQYRELPVNGKRRVAPVHVPQEPPVYEAAGPVKTARYTFTYSGAVVSHNKTFAGMHWSKRKALTDKWHGIFRGLLHAAGVGQIERFRLHLRYNSRHDVDNLVLTCKWAVDAMKGVYVAEDSKKHYRGIAIEADETLPNNTFVFTIIELA
ncbi:MAG: hypothetical protein NVS3B25_07300 [Hymenobacter sp.]